jgi:hypothetical protein
MPRSARAWILPLLAALLSVIVLGATLSLRLLDLDTYKARIVAEVKSSLKRELRYQSGDFSLRFGPSFTFSGITIKEKDGVGDFIKADRLTIRIAIIPLLRREVVLSRMQLERPEVELSRDKNGVFNVSDLFSGPSNGEAPGIRGVELKKARVRFSDAFVSPTPVVTELTDTDLYLSRLVRGATCDFKLSGSLLSGKNRVPLFIAGAALIPKAGEAFDRCQIDGRVRTGSLDAAYFWPYYSRFVPFKSLAGGVSLDAHFKGRPSAFKSKGELKVSRLDLDYPQIFHARLAPRSVSLAYELELSGKELDIPVVKLNVDGLNVNGSCRLSDLHSGDIRITAKATTTRFNLREFRQFIPYGIIVKDVADFIEQKIAGGFYRLETGRLDGRVSQILHMERGQNYNILFVKANVEEGVVNYGSGIPVFSAIKGELSLAGKDFILKGMSAKYGSSPFTLDGRIADYPLDTPSRYLFTALVHPRQPEAHWLFGNGRGQKLTLSDGGILKLRGEGTSSLYNLAGECDLTPASYAFNDLIAKPQGRPNTLSFRGAFTKEDFRLSALQYNLGSLVLAATAQNRYKGGVAVEVNTNQFQAGEIAPLVPTARKYQSVGRMQAQLHGNGAALDRLTWTGNVALSGAGFKYGDIKPVSGVSGSIRISKDALDTSQIAGRVGNSIISGRASLTGFNSPVVSLSFTSPSLDPADIGLPQGKTPLRAEKVQGNLSYSKEKDQLQINSLVCTLGKNTLQIKGSVHELQHPRIDLAVNSAHLDVDDLIPLFGSSSGGNTRFSLRAHLSATEGVWREVPFQRLRCLVLLEDRILYLQDVSVGAFDGDATGRVRVDFGSALPRYQVTWNIQKGSAERVLRAMGVTKQELTGTLTMQGEMTARGEAATELRKSALGAVKLRVEHGSMRKFATLSKVFSILNFSQLFKGQLPDMVSGGMPFNRITGDLAFRDGFASTQNLFMDSNAINLSVVGSFDLVRDQLDLSIGAQPLQTVDKVVSHIPVIGWVLVGKDHSLVTTYFEAKGHIEDPKVTAVPVKSLGKGVLNVFRRVFELPGRLITDTGEVMLGK